MVYENGKEVSREFFSSSVYRATPDEVTVGTGENTEETKSPEENGAKEAIPPEGSADGTENEVNANESGTVFGG